MISIIVILGIGIFLGLLIGGLVWAVREDSKEEKDNENNQK
jgi:cbb3-type cytochrome oxidase subunit 3